MAPDLEGFRDPDPTTLARYLSGESDRDECARVERWIAASPEHAALVDAMRAAWERRPADEFDPDDAVWRRLRGEMTLPPPRPALVPDREPPRVRSFQVGGRRRPWLAAVAAAAAVLGAVLLGPGLWQSEGPVREAVERTAREIATRRGERLALRLADGTRVVLSPESRLRLAGTFSARGQGPREVELEGEAFFEVTHDSLRPFRVHTPTGMAEDLGTEFVVTSYPETGGTRVVVASGIVALRQAEADPATAALLTLTRGDLGAVDADGNTTLARGVDVGPYVALAEGTLIFDGTPLGEALPALRRWYDVDLRLGDPALATRKLTATFRDEPITQVLQLVAMSLDLTLERRGDVVTLRAAGSAGSPR